MARRRRTATTTSKGIDGRNPSEHKHPNHPGKESIYFHSWGECLKFAEENSGKGQGASARAESTSWTGTANMAEALYMARNGWAEGVAIAGPLCADITDKVTSLVEIEHVNYDVEGIGLDVATYLNGEPECWQRFEKETSGGEGIKHIRIVMDVTVSAGISQNIITARGAAVAALIQGLEFAGYRVQLEVLPLCNGAAWESRVLVKAADQDLDLSRVIFALAHPSMLRRIGFALQEGCPERDNNYGYGPCSDAIDRGDLYIGSAMLYAVQWATPGSAMRWVLDQMTAQGIKLLKS